MLLRAYYDLKVANKRTPDLKYCDFRQVFEIGFELHKVGLYLQLDPARLRAAMAAGGEDLVSFFLREPLDVGPYRRSAWRIEQAVEMDPEANDEIRMKASDFSGKASDDLSAHIMCWIIADVNVAFVMQEPQNSAEQEWARLACQRLVSWSTDAAMRDTLGDPLTDAMRPLYSNPPALLQFSHAGGLGALFGDWVRSLQTSLMATVDAHR